MTKPVRIQLRRTKGWRMPENTVKVDRSTRWGNPFPVGSELRIPGHKPLIVDAELSVVLFRAWIRPHQHNDWVTMLRGKNLACWCKLPDQGKPDICHAAVLIEIANAEHQK